MAKARVLPLLEKLPLLLACILFMSFPLSGCASPSGRPEDEPVPAQTSIPDSQLNCMTESQAGKPAGKPAMAGYEIPPWATLSILAGAEPGPVLLVVAGVHGDEASGPMAARNVAAGPPPARGVLVILPVASPEALAAGQRWVPGWSDLNRAFPEVTETMAPGIATATGATGTAGSQGSAGSIQSARTAYAVSDPAYQRADEIMALIASIKPDLLLDLHESDRYWTEGEGPVLVMPASSRSTELVLELLESPAMEGFSFTGPPPAGSLVAAVDGLLSIPALLVEAPDSLAVEARIMAHRVAVNTAMLVLGMVVSVDSPNAVQPPDAGADSDPLAGEEP